MMAKYSTTLAISLAFAASVLTGCSNKCPQIKSDYEAMLATESAFLEQLPKEDAPVHFAVLMRTSLLNTLVTHAATEGLDKALTLTDTIKVASGQSISVKTDGHVADLAVYADKACENCVRLAGRLDGTAAIKVPILPIQRVPLRGTFSLVAPIVFARTDSGETQVQLDLSKAAQIGKSSLDADVAQLPPTWANVLKSPLSKLLLDAVSKGLGNVTVASFPPPDLGIKGLKTGPAVLKTDAKDGVIYLGFTSNLALPQGLTPDTTLPRSKNMAISMHPSIVAPVIQAALKSDAVPRRYNDDGKANPNGTMHVTLSSASLKPADGKNAFDFSMRLWNLQESGQCYWADATAHGEIGLADNAIKVDVKNVELKDSSLPGIALAIANWKTSQVVEAGKLVLEKSLSEEMLNFPGSTSKIEKSAFEVGDSVIQFQGYLGVKAAGSEGMNGNDEGGTEE